MIDRSPHIPLLLVRHGATQWTESGRYQGRKDTLLSPEGWRAAARLALQLREADIGLVVSSPLARARQTASLIAHAAGAPLSLDPRLVELDYGDWEGLTQPQVKAQWPEALRSWKRDIASARPPGGEALAELAQRVNACLGDLAARPPRRGTVAIVAHDWVLRVALLALRGEGLAAARGVSFAPAAAYPAQLLAKAPSDAQRRHPARPLVV